MSPKYAKMHKKKARNTLKCIPKQEGHRMS